VRPFSVNCPHSILWSMLLCTGAASIAVGEDYEFARQLWDNQRERSGLQAEDLIERLAHRLLNAATEPER